MKIEAAESFVASYMLEHNGYWVNSATFVCDGSKCSGTVNGKKESLTIRSTVPTSGSIYVDKNGDASIKDYLTFGKYKCVQNKDEITCKKQ